jgi:hypothetical protein
MGTNCKLATKLENVIAHEEQRQTPYEIIEGKNPRWIRHMRKFGEIGIVYDITKIKPTLGNRGFSAMFIGYP